MRIAACVSETADCIAVVLSTQSAMGIELPRHGYARQSQIAKTDTAKIWQVLFTDL